MTRLVNRSFARKIAVLGLGAAAALSSVSLAPAAGVLAADVKLASGSTWKGDVGAKVRVVYKDLASGKDATVEGEVVKIDPKSKTVRVKVSEGGKTVEKTIFWSDVRTMETISGGSSATAPANAPKAAAGGSKDGTAPAAKAGDKTVVFIMPWEGTVGIGARHDEIERIGKEADKIGPGQIIVLEVISPGGLVIEGDKIDATLMDLKKRHRVIAWIKEAISAAAFTSLHCEEIYFQRVGTLGAITMFAGTKSIEGSELDAWVKKVGDVTQEAGRSRWIGEAMVTNAPLLSYDKDENGNVKWYNTLEGKYKLSDEIQNLTLNADTALDCKFSDGTADTPEELIALLHLDKDKVEISKIGYKIHEDWQKNLKTCLEEKTKTIRDLNNPAGADEAAMIGNRIKAIKKLIAWWDKCSPCLQYENPPVPPKEELEKIIKDLQKQLGDMKKQGRG
ncbi:MAG: hypothetical protein ACOYMM_05825 [Phycisphaerales bacterium]